eukprot:TRINITY_DN2205_c1_g1_i1.p1 TRINITY_DN2205_c1_g1~~TRINITY_DN2205_c1_g1_i1.p1  ORF type:complete len:664 (+),score=264.51 TRINITY_DN2205_c1_g1_i1:154-2145(+)
MRLTNISKWIQSNGYNRTLLHRNRSICNGKRWKSEWNLNGIEKRIEGREEKGLFGFGIMEPKDWINYSKIKLKECEESVDRIERNGLSPKETLDELDSIAKNICLVSDPAELCRQVHSNRQMREAAHAAYDQIIHFVHLLNTNQNIYHQSKVAFENGSNLSEEAKTVLHHLKREFEVNGVHLSAEERENLLNLQSKIFENSETFTQNIQSNSSRNSSFDTYEILRKSSNPKLRKEAWIADNSEVEENISVLEQLTSNRDSLAKSLGCDSFLQLSLSHHRIFSKEENVYDFLNQLSNDIRPRAISELELLKEKKMQAEGDSTINAWDELYYSQKVIQSKSNLSEQMSEYFTIDNCIEGMSLFCSQLFGISLKPIPFKSNEQWHSSVIKLELSEGGKVIGILYLDIFNRSEKIGGSATYAIQFPTVEEKSNELEEIPRIAMVCCFPMRKTLSHTNFVTLFHEFGHCLAGLLSRTNYYHLSGTRTPIDFAEFPSTLMEHFAWDHRVLSAFAKHKGNGSVIPEEIVTEAKRVNFAFAGLETQEQIVRSIFDLNIHGKHPLPHSLVDYSHSIRSKYSSIPSVPSTFWFTSFRHMTGYSAGYYSYLFSRIFSSAAWEKRFSIDPWNRKEGERYRNEILQYGGSKDASSMLHSFLGEKPTTKYFLKSLSV